MPASRRLRIGSCSLLMAGSRESSETKRAVMRRSWFGDGSTALDIKLFRDVRRLWAQVLAVALVVGGGVATLVLAVGSHRSLEETRIAYYERYGFGDVFAQAKRAPKALADRIREIPGVVTLDTRIAKLALLDIPGFS